MSEARRGKLSKEEISYIESQLELRSDEEIAAIVKRTPDLIAKIRGKTVAKKQVYGEETDLITNQLEVKPFWSSVKQQLSLHEQEIFKQYWVSLCKQFEEQGLQTTDDLMIKDYIILDILMSRNLADQRRLEIEIESLDKFLSQEQNKQGAERNLAEIANARQQINNMMAARNKAKDAFTDLQQRKDAKMTQLRGSREQRFKQYEESKTNIFELIKVLSTQKNRKAEGRRNALCQLCAERERQRLSQPMEYADGSIDIPLLTPEVIMEYNKNDPSTSEEILSETDD